MEQQTIEQAYQALLSALDWLNRFGEHAPIQFGGEWDVHVQLDEARAQMERQWPELAEEVDDRPLHTNDRPYCSDSKCPCHYDMELYEQYIHQPMQGGLLTRFQAYALRWGENV